MNRYVHFAIPFKFQSNFVPLGIVVFFFNAIIPEWFAFL